MSDTNREEIYRKTFSVEPGTVLKVYSKTGNIDVSSWDRDYVEVVVVKHNNLLSRFLKAPSVEVTPDRECIVRTLYSTALSEAVPVDDQITIPRGVRVAHVETTTGSIKLTDILGDVDAKTTTGAIQINGVGGFVKAMTNTGSIDITDVNGIDEVKTSTGKISVEVPAIRNDLKISANTGSITALFAPDIAAQLEVDTSTGKISYEDLPLTANQSPGKGLVGRLGIGGSKINIITATGSISLKRLPKQAYDDRAVI